MVFKVFLGLLFYALCCSCLLPGLLFTAQMHNAHQLSAWCLHFISTNYMAFTARPEFSLLQGDNLAFVEEHQWPPKSYLTAVDEYEKKYMKSMAGKDKCRVM